MGGDDLRPDNVDDWDSADYEFGPTGTSEGPLKNVFDSAFNGAARSEMYRALIAPDLFPHERRWPIENWSQQDREEYCGGLYAR